MRYLSFELKLHFEIRNSEVVSCRFNRTLLQKHSINFYDFDIEANDASLDSSAWCRCVKLS